MEWKEKRWTRKTGKIMNKQGRDVARLNGKRKYKWSKVELNESFFGFSFFLIRRGP